MSVLDLQNTINWSRSYNQFIPLTAGAGQEPAISIASMIRNAFLGAPQTWYFNRNEITFNLVAGQQDYPQSIAANGNDFGYIEKVSIQLDNGDVIELKDVYNYATLAKSSFPQQPSAVSLHKLAVSAGVQTVTFRFLGVPDQAYPCTIIYQRLAPQFGPFLVTQVAVGAPAVYTGTFDPYSFPTGSTATISGCTNAGNNGKFPVVAVTPTQLSVTNSSAVNETTPTNPPAVANNYAWDPIPNQFSDVYNSLFLAEVFIIIGDEKQADVYRKRGIASFLARATGLSDTQKDAFIQQFLARDRERAVVQGHANLGVQSKSV